AIPKVASDAIVFEQAIGAAHRAGVDPAELTFALWGAGITKISAFTYVSYEGLQISIEILGGENSCATGLIVENLVKYNLTNAEGDARDLYARTLMYPRGADSHVILSAHSWGGAVAEYLTENRGDIESGGGVIGLGFTIAAGVPATIPNYRFAGPGLRELD